MILPKVPKPSKAEENDAYELATLRDKDTCQKCRRDCGPTARDHRVNRSQGGRTVVSNLHVLGLDCHKWATEHPLDAQAEGWAAPSYADPREWPARRWMPIYGGRLHLSWVLYSDDGEIAVITEEDAALRMYGAA
ncbi:HNH endonuclease signature motif containing protein [Cryobacterium sp. PH31-O1]|uniref:HNH endonuclease n=1 Tax=Cryobacterium sp. PH31-O1 TaxID=3046306 RepID=UPI0024B8787B|nr:HNH endonuclease signature motif containing protein [Cryobacterium sp. PH31-O1]MDJ0337434.1 HNH endonuclease signature motif containing protein [Cryobacterium sp. PH31-O1]